MNSAQGAQSPPQKKRVGMNHAAFGACELGRQLRQKKLRELKNKQNEKKTGLSTKMNSFNRLRASYSKQRPLFMEMLGTERLYVDSLHVVVSRFMLPLQVALEIFPVPILTKKEISTLFGNIAQLFEVNMELLRIIETNLDETRNQNTSAETDDDSLATAFAEAFKNMLPVFKAFYGVYVCNYDQSIDLLEELRQSNSLFRKFLDIATRHEDCKGLDLGDFLIKPIQRICRYPLFFSSLLECTEKSNPIYSVLQTASNAVSKIADQVNQTGKEAENAMKSFEISNQLEGLEKYDPTVHVVAPGRRFVHQFECKVHYSFQAPGAKPTKEMRHAPYKKKPRDCFLFTDALLIAKSVGERLEFRFWLELENILITIPPSHSGNGGNNHAGYENKKNASQQDDEDEAFSAAQKRLPLDIVRIKIIKNEKKKNKQQKQQNESPGGNSFSSSSNRSLSECNQANNNTRNGTGMAVVEKYTLWFKGASERTKVFQRIVSLQGELEKRNQDRQTHIINHQKNASIDIAPPPLVLHQRSHTHSGITAPTNTTSSNTGEAASHEHTRTA